TLALSSANSLVIARGASLPFLLRSPPGECTVGACCVPRATIRSGSEHHRCRNVGPGLGQWRESLSCPWGQRTCASPSSHYVKKTLRRFRITGSETWSQGFPAGTRDFSAVLNVPKARRIAKAWNP